MGQRNQYQSQGAASCVNVLDLKVESLGKPLHVSSPLGIRVRVDKICRDMS